LSGQSHIKVTKFQAGGGMRSTESLSSYYCHNYSSVRLSVCPFVISMGRACSVITRRTLARN